jgi:hypothetical protein
MLPELGVQCYASHATLAPMSEDSVTWSRATRDGLDRLRPAVEAGAPWPLAARFDHDPEASWGPMELLAHVAEMLPFWLGEVEKILAGAPEPVPFGRLGSDPTRIAIIGRDRTLPVGELYVRIHDGLARWSGRVETLSPTQLEKVGLHPRLGEMSVAAIVDRQVVQHVDEHVRQLDAILGTGPEAG